jgi:maleylacetoacetate isomerase
MELYTYCRSKASFRVRIALNLKGIAREDSFLHLEKGDQFAAAYRAINPQMVVPTLIDGDIKLFQSLAILEYLEERYPEPPLLPPDPLARAWVRGLALINVADSHPLIVPRVRHYLTDLLKVSDEQRLAWIQHWLGAGLQAIETLLVEHPSSGAFCHGDRPTFAGICLVTQVTPAMTFNLALDPYPRVMRVYDACMAIPAFADAPPRQSSPTLNRGVRQLRPDLLLLPQRPLPLFPLPRPRRAVIILRTRAEVFLDHGVRCKLAVVLAAGSSVRTLNTPSAASTL